MAPPEATQPARNNNHESERAARDPREDPEVDRATEEDLQTRDASEMPSEPQNPVNPNAEAAS
jgi:hypothetical protein